MGNLFESTAEFSTVHFHKIIWNTIMKVNYDRQRCKSIPDPLILSINSGGVKDLLMHLSSKLFILPVGCINHFEPNHI